MLLSLQENECSEITNSLDALKRRERSRRDKIAALRQEVQELERRFSADPPSSDTREVQLAIEAINNEIREGFQKVEESQTQLKEIVNEGRELNREINQKAQQLEDLQNIRTRRLSFLANTDPDCHRAVIWMQNNRDRFESHVYDPACLEINIRDQQYVNAIEHCLGGARSNTMKTWVCQTKHDYELFTHELIDNMKLRLQAVWLDRTLEQFRPPMGVQQLRRQYGLDNYILDLIDGPSPILAFLCDSSNIHQTSLHVSRKLGVHGRFFPVTLRTVNSEQIMETSDFQHFVAGDNAYIIKKSRYGNHHRLTNCRKFNHATLLTDSGGHL
ncbi:hypothetical protein BC938DRAFT_478180 [Jimgerdemannia flammicorona]|uniref:Structural maintenance of chromosomes protein 5 n=1 Tax=Jimgerdemannia flammicorona TaxID=994334 RepID=A0A433QN92_9FUNG|nr:hypothetical protein BC938DRAFT_478180 [Jimgerdemannia flammicorona]